MNDNPLSMLGRHQFPLNIPLNILARLKANVRTTLTSWIIKAISEKMERDFPENVETLPAAEPVVETPKPKNRLQWCLDYRKDTGCNALESQAAWRAEHEPQTAPVVKPDEKPAVDNWLDV